MKPSEKSEEMKQGIKELFGVDRRDAIKQDMCAPKPLGCGGLAKIFKDDLSRKEFSISGLCQECQDEIFDNDN